MVPIIASARSLSGWDANGNIIAPGNPAKAGDTITLYCTGLDELNPVLLAGDYGPASSSTNIPVSVTIGGQNAPVSYSGLARPNS